jgi:putative addiction module antidote
MQPVKITRIGNSAGIILSRDMLARLRVEKGDTLFLVETPEGYHLTAHDPELATQMEAARAIMHRRRAALRELAK